MRIYYVTNIRFPTEKAHGWQIAKMCDAFSALGHEVELVVPNRKTQITQAPAEYYDLKHQFKITRLPVFDALAVSWIPKSIAFAIFEASFIRAVRRWKSKSPSGDQALVMTRDQFLVPHLARPGWKSVFEVHDITPRFFWLHKKLARVLDVIVASNEWKKNEIIKRWGKSIRGKVLALHNAIDISPYESLPAKEEARQRLGWKSEEKYAVYTGHLYDWKGVYVLAQASRFLPPGNNVVMLGGTPEDEIRMRSFLKEHDLNQVQLIPHASHEEVLTYLAAADCFVLPNSAKFWHSKYTTSPIKLWEYLAARRPVVASDLPSIRELVGDEEAIFVKPDDSKSLAQGIGKAFDGDQERIRKGWEKARGQTWENRAQKIIQCLY